LRVMAKKNYWGTFENILKILILQESMI